MSKTAMEIQQEFMANLSDEYQKTVGFPSYDLLKAVAVVMSDFAEKIDKASELSDVEKLTGDMLDRFIRQRKGLERKVAVSASGRLTATVIGTAVIPQGTLFETEEHIQFRSTKAVTITSEAADKTIPIQAVTPGTIGNVDAGTITVIPVTIENLTAVINISATTGGYTAESDEEFRGRYLDAIRRPITAGNKYQYESWAMEVNGVGDAKCFPLANGANTVEVCIIGNDGRPAAASLIKAVQDYIDPEGRGCGEGVAPIGAYCTITTATALTVDVYADLEIYPEYSLQEIKERVTMELDSYFKEIGFSGKSISYAKISSLIMGIIGVNDCANLKVNNQTGNISLEERQVAVIGAVSLV